MLDATVKVRRLFGPLLLVFAVGAAVVLAAAEVVTAAAVVLAALLVVAT